LTDYPGTIYTENADDLYRYYKAQVEHDAKVEKVIQRRKELAERRQQETEECTEPIYSKSQGEQQNRLQTNTEVTQQLVDHAVNSGIDVQLTDENSVPQGVQAEVQSELIYTTIAPYFNTTLTLENKEEITKAVQEHFWNHANALAKQLGIKINNISTNIGGFEFSEGEIAGQQVKELSYTFELGNATQEQADKFASLLGDLGYENQEAVISYNYLDAGATNADAFEISIPILDVFGAIQALEAAGIKDFTINENDKSIKLLNFDTSNPDATVEQVTTLINELNKLNNYDSTRQKTTNKIASRYIDRETRRSLYQKWMGTDSSRQQEGLRSLYSKAQKILGQIKDGETSKVDDLDRFYTTAGTVFGWTQNGKIYLTPQGFNPNTLLHEYTHLWDLMVQQVKKSVLVGVQK